MQIKKYGNDMQVLIVHKKKVNQMSDCLSHIFSFRTNWSKDVYLFQQLICIVKVITWFDN